MSHFWGKLTRLVPTFTGTPEEAKDNTQSHSWRTVRLADRFNEVNNSALKVTECSKCGILAQHHASSYPCGTPPEELTLEELLQQKESGPTPKP